MIINSKFWSKIKSKKYIRYFDVSNKDFYNHKQQSVRLILQFISHESKKSEISNNQPIFFNYFAAATDYIGAD